MGSYLSRQNDGVEEIDTSSNFNYSFPPESGTFFSDQFYMGGKKFDTAQPEGYLFGDNSDLNYLGPKPHNFPYQLPNDNQPIRALKCLVNIRKDSLRLVRYPYQQGKPEYIIRNPNDDENVVSDPPLYNLEFTFDADCPCSITVYYNAAEELYNDAVKFTSQKETEKSETTHFNPGCNQQFCVPGHIINPAKLHKNKQKAWSIEDIPIAIQVCADCGSDFAGHSHITYAAFEKGSDGSWNIKVNKQKQVINGVCYLFQEIYGIENKVKSSKEQSGEGDDNLDDDDDDVNDEENSECVVCLSEMKDTLILPCKHLCLCSVCANQLRFQQSGCPICRQPFRALLQIRAVRKKSPLSGENVPETIPPQDDDEICNEDSGLDVATPPGYEVIPLIDAINGPVTATTFSVASLSTSGANTRAGSVRSNPSSTRSSMRRSKRKSKGNSTVDIENETSSLGEDRCRESGRKKSRSWRKKKGSEHVAEKPVELASNESVLSSELPHTYTNENLVCEVEDIGMRDVGDSSKDALKCDDVTMSISETNQPIVDDDVEDRSKGGSYSEQEGAELNNLVPNDPDPLSNQLEERV